MDFVLIGTNSRWRLRLPQGCTQQEPAERKHLVSLAPAFDLRESHATEGRPARSPARSPRPRPAEPCLSVPWAAWSLVRQEREHATPRRGYPKPAPSLGNGRPDRLPVPLAGTQTSLPASRSCCPSAGAWDGPSEARSSPTGRVALMPAAALRQRRRHEDDGLWHPEEPSGNLFCSRWVCVQAGRGQRDEVCFPLARLFQERWAGSSAATGVWAQVAPLYPSVLAGLPDACIRRWFPAPPHGQRWEGRAFTWHLVLLRLPGRLQAEERASCAWASLGDRASPARADRLPSSAGAARENGALSLGFASTKSRS